jgi:hypothetical protein
LLLAAEPTLKLATVGFSQVGMSDAEASFFAEHFSVQLAAVDEQNVRVSTPKDMAAILGIEKQKQLLGCSDEQSSCMAELAGALGADGIVSGQIAKVGKSFQVNVKILAADGSKTLFLHSSKLLSSEEELIGELAKLRPQTAPAAAIDASPSATIAAEGGRSRNPLKLLPGVLGVAGVVLSGVAFGIAGEEYAKLSDSRRWPTLDEPTARNWRDKGRENAVIGTVLLSAGLVIIAGTLLWFLLT